MSEQTTYGTIDWREETWATVLRRDEYSAADLDIMVTTSYHWKTTPVGLWYNTLYTNDECLFKGYDKQLIALNHVFFEWVYEMHQSYSINSNGRQKYIFEEYRKHAIKTLERIDAVAYIVFKESSMKNKYQIVWSKIKRFIKYTIL